jgi:RnfABCDGE-type electron transport complex G subunit
MSKIVYFFKQSWLLIVASLAFGLILAAAEGALGPRIAANQKSKVTLLCQALVNEAEEFQTVVQAAEISHPKRTLTTDILQGTDAAGQVVGYAFIAEGPGFAGPVRIVIGADPSLTKIFGFRVLASNETPGFGDKITQPYYQDQFKGAPYGPLELSKVGNPATIDSQIVAISGATVSSEAVTNIFNTYVDGVKTVLVKEGLIDGN